MKIGQRASVKRRYETADLARFAELTGAEISDHVPEPLIAALFSYLLGVELPGAGTNYLKQDLAFRSAAPLGVELTASVEIRALRPEKHLVDLWACCVADDGVVICEGRALVKAKDVAG